MSLSPLESGIRKSNATWHARLLRPFFVLASVSPTCESGASVCCVLSHPTCLWAAFTFFFRLPGTLLPSRKKKHSIPSCHRHLCATRLVRPSIFLRSREPTGCAKDRIGRHLQHSLSSRQCRIWKRFVAWRAPPTPIMRNTEGGYRRRGIKIA